MKSVLIGDDAWRLAMQRILTGGVRVAPRGQPTLELLGEQVVHAQLGQATVTSPARKLNYRFMTAEALWILRGDDRVEPLAKHVKRMAEFSDDGETLAGAYGPPVTKQLPYVVSTLQKDRDTRQAVLTIWRQNPPPSKDIPCTVAMAFTIRRGRLHQHVYMRSSDVWLGLPYDLFSFSCIGLKVACLYNRLSLKDPVRPGCLTIAPVSSHLYERDQAAALAVLGIEGERAPTLPGVPEHLIEAGDWHELERDLERVEAGEPARYWRCVP